MKKRTLLISALLLLAAAGFEAPAQYGPRGRTAAEARELTDKALATLTLDEKILLLGGEDNFYTHALPSIGLRRIKMADGPQGIGAYGKNGKSTAYPANVLLAATWDPEAAYAYGEALANDCKAKGVDIILGPGVNMCRAPFCGRNFEYMGEDPVLAGKIAAGYIKGVQDQGVLATVKHFLGNNSDYARTEISNDIDTRALYELYMPAFKTAVQEGKVGMLMSSYNPMNGVYTAEAKRLMHDIVRGEWGFEGITVTDWGAMRHTVPAVTGGTDLEMPSAAYMNADDIHYYLLTGDITEEMIDQKVDHILYTVYAYGLDKPLEGGNPDAEVESSAATALDVARQGIVLLKNKGNILPLGKKRKKVAVVGANATAFLWGGGSGAVDPYTHTTYLDGIEALGPDHGCEVSYIDLSKENSRSFFTAPGSQEQGLSVRYYTNADMQEPAAFVMTESIPSHVWDFGHHLEGMPQHYYSALFTGVIRPEESGEYVFNVGADDGYRFYLDGKLLAERWDEGSFEKDTFTLNLEKGREYDLRMEYFQHGGEAAIEIKCMYTGDLDKATKAAMAAADVLVACVGFDNTTEKENADRTFELPLLDRRVLDAATASGTPVVAVLNSGAGADLSKWDDSLAALLWAGYAGQASGQAMAEVLFGDVNPSGHLPSTFDRSWADNPCHDTYHDADGDKHVAYSEGVFTGYRGYQKKGVAPLYPFGHGLSYTTFAISDAKATADAEGNVTVTCTLRNKGKRAGAQTVQAYVGPQGEQDCPVERPALQLKAFDKVELAPGESRQVTLTIPRDGFAYFDVPSHSWKVPKGTYRVALGFSSADLPAQATVQL